MRLVLTGPDIFDGNLWNVSFGRYRSDDPISGSGAHASSSFYVRCARNSYGTISEYFTTGTLFEAELVGSPDGGIQQTANNTFNREGPFIVIGSQSLYNSAARFLNGVSSLPDSQYAAARWTNFSGRVGHIRFWSKAVSETEFKEHTMNFKSLGVDNPKDNFNFDRVPTGAFERLRLDASTDQSVTESNSLGTIQVDDFSQQYVFDMYSTKSPWDIFSPEKLNASALSRINSASFFHMSGSGFENSKKVIIPNTFYYSYLSPRFDMMEASDKIRVRSYLSKDKVDNSDYAYHAPLFEMPRDEIPADDTRFAVDFSITQAVDEDIMTMFSSLDFFDNALGDPNLMFDDFYPNLDQLKKIYFNRLVDKINIKQFFEFFKWFDTMLGTMIEQLIPKKTRFNGVNFVIESHVLERHRMRYLSDEIYLKLSEREATFSDLVDDFLSE